MTARVCHGKPLLLIRRLPVRGYIGHARTHNSQRLRVFPDMGERLPMRIRTKWLSTVLAILVLSGMIGMPVAAAQVATPEVSPIVIDEATPDASPAASPVPGETNAACRAGPSRTSAEVRSEIEELYPIEQPANTE